MQGLHSDSVLNKFYLATSPREVVLDMVLPDWLRFLRYKSPQGVESRGKEVVDVAVWAVRYFEHNSSKNSWQSSKSHVFNWP